MLERLFTSRVRIGLLSQFLLHPDEAYHVRALEKIVNAQYSAIWRELENLEQAGVIASKEDTGRRFFRLNQDYPLLHELRGMILKTAGLGDRIRAGLERLGGIAIAFVFGSYAEGQVDAYSDIDLMIIGEADLEQLSSLMAELEAELGRSINVINYTRGEWQAKLEAGDPFASQVYRSPKLMLRGSEDEL